MITPAATLDTSSWTPAGETVNARYFAIEPRVLALVAHPKTVDDGTTAVENAALQRRHFETHGRGVLLVFIDPTCTQERSARDVYTRSFPNGELGGVAYIGGSLMSRAAASLFIGFSKPRIPIKMFATLDEALPWARALVGTFGGGKT